MSGPGYIQCIECGASALDDGKELPHTESCPTLSKSSYHALLVENKKLKERSSRWKAAAKVFRNQREKLIDTMEVNIFLNDSSGLIEENKRLKNQEDNAYEAFLGINKLFNKLATANKLWKNLAKKYRKDLKKLEG